MALRDQPYLPLYVDRFTADEDLRNCSASATGVHIRVMCLFHKTKSKTYGTIQLKKEFATHFAIPNGQANGQQVGEPTREQLAILFAKQFAKQLTYAHDVIVDGLMELLENDVYFFDGVVLCQGGMIKQGKISDIRKDTGLKGVKKRLENQKKNKSFGIAKGKQFGSPNGEANAINIITTINKDNRIGGTGEKEEGEFIDYYIGNWHLTTKVKNCLYYYLTNEEFDDDRRVGFELFARQYVKFDDVTVWEYLKKWGEIFNDSIKGKWPERNMRGEDSWVQHFHNWLKGKNLSIPPLEDESKLTLLQKKELFIKTLDPYLEKYGKEMLNEFFRHWGEPDQTKLNLRWELEKTWDISMRLTTWYKKGVKFSSK